MLINKCYSDLKKQAIHLTPEFFESTSETDGDTITDGKEFLEGMNPFKKDTDGDGLQDNINMRLNHLFPRQKLIQIVMA